MTSLDFQVTFPHQTKRYTWRARLPATTQPQTIPTWGTFWPPPIDGRRHAGLPWPAMRRGSTPRRSAGSDRHPLPCQSNTAAGLPLKNKKRICTGRSDGESTELCWTHSSQKRSENNSLLRVHKFRPQQKISKIQNQKLQIKSQQSFGPGGFKYIWAVT